MRLRPVLVRVIVSSRTARLSGLSAPPRSIAASSASMARGVLLVRVSITVAGLTLPSSRTSVAIVWSSRWPTMPLRVNHWLTGAMPPIAAMIPSVAWLLLRVIMSSHEFLRGHHRPGAHRSDGLRAPARSATDSIIGKR
jgi:hypothetical protein